MNEGVRILGDETYIYFFGSCLQQTAYIDVCDDTSYAFRAKSLQTEAVTANVPAITTAGIYPGVSNGVKSYHKSLAFLCLSDSFIDAKSLFEFSQ